MIYEKFLETIKASVQDKLGTGHQVTLHQVLKNNGSMLDGLSILTPGTPFAPTIYLNTYYDEAERGIPLSLITDQIILLYEDQNCLPLELAREFDTFDLVKDKVAFRLISASANEVLLSDLPHYDFLDLAVVFYLIMVENEYGQMTALLHNEHLSMWNVTKETLLAFAEINTPRLLPPRLLPIEDALIEINQGEGSILLPELPCIYLTVLTNQSGINGAAALLYKDVLKNFAAQEEDDLLILPSSIHEVLLTPVKKALSYEELNTMVTLINHSDVPPEDRLSDHIYHYSREQDCVTIPLSFSAASEIGNPQ